MWIKAIWHPNCNVEVSNITQVALFISQADHSPGESHPNPRVNISTLVSSVVGSVAIVSVILSATIYILKKKRNAIRSRTGF